MDVEVDISGLRAEALERKFVSRQMIQDQIFTERELRILGWEFDGFTDGWSPIKLDEAKPTIEPTALAVRDSSIAEADDERRALEVTHGQRFLAVAGQSAPYSVGPGRHHKPAYDDYEIAKTCIRQALGDMSDVEIWGDAVLCAVFCRPNITSGGVILPVKEIKEDWWQHKAVMVVKIGPDAFQGDESYLRARFGDKRPPEVGDWLFAAAEAGIQTNFCGDGGTRPQGRDPMGRLMDLFEWEGWPCRVIPHDRFIGRLSNPQAVV